MKVMVKASQKIEEYLDVLKQFNLESVEIEDPGLLKERKEYFIDINKGGIFELKNLVGEEIIILDKEDYIWDGTELTKKFPKYEYIIEIYNGYRE